MKRISTLLGMWLILTTSLFAQDMKEVAKEIGINFCFVNNVFIGGGVAIFDFNKDGHMDIYMTGGIFQDKLYINDGNGKFIDKQIGLKNHNGETSMGVIVGDINNDGYDDIFVTYFNTSSCVLYKNIGGTGVEDITATAGVTTFEKWGMGATFVDINLDGYLDILMLVYNSDTQVINNDRNLFFINNKNETFTEKGQHYGFVKTGYGLAVAATNFDADNDPDIMIANDYGFIISPNKLYENQYPKDSLKEISEAAGVDCAIFAMGIGITDWDEDGDFDYYITNIGKNLFYRNNGNKTFTNIAKETGIEHGFVDVKRSTAWSAIFFDYDNDTHDDLALTNGFVGEANTATADPNKFWKNDGNGKFTDITEYLGFGNTARSRGMAVGDLNNDGLEDLVIVNCENNKNSPNKNLVYMNKLSNGNNWLNVKLEGTTSNRNGYGARIKVFAGGRMFLKEVEGGANVHLSHNSPIKHFGLGKYQKIDSISVIWPGGIREVFKDLPVNAVLNIKQQTSAELTYTKNITLCEGESYDGVVYTASTKLTNKVTKTGGFDSIAIVNITVNPKYDRNLFAGICFGDTYNGVKPTKDTILTFTGKTYLGCDSNVKVNITVSNPTATSSTLTFCDKAEYNGNTYTASTMLVDSLKNFLGCDSIANIFLTVNKSVNVTTKVELCSGETYKGITYTENKELKEFGKAFNGCDSLNITQIIIKENQKFNKDTVVIIGDTYLGFKVEKDTIISYVFPKQGSNGCDSIYAIRIKAEYPQSIDPADEVNIFNINLNQAGNVDVVYNLTKDTGFRLKLLNSTGAVVFEKDLGIQGIGSGKYSFNTSELSKGAYILILQTDTGLLSKKLIIE